MLECSAQKTDSCTLMCFRFILQTGKDFCEEEKGGEKTDLVKTSTGNGSDTPPKGSCAKRRLSDEYVFSTPKLAKGEETSSHISPGTSGESSVSDDESAVELPEFTSYVRMGLRDGEIEQVWQMVSLSKY